MDVKELLSVKNLVEHAENVLQTLWDMLPNHLPTLLHGYVLMMLWSWFVMPVAHFLPGLGYLQAVGLTLTARLLHKRCVEEFDLDHECAWSLGFLVVGFALHFFM